MISGLRGCCTIRGYLMISLVTLGLGGCADRGQSRSEVYRHLESLESYLESDDSAELVLGMDDSSVLTIFSSVARAAIDDTGNRIVVADRAYPLLRVFNREGEFLHSMGERGEGPGEMKSLQAVAISRAGEVAALHDFGRFTVFDDQGALKASVPVGDMHALAVAPGCAEGVDEWVMYGPSPARPGSGMASWLHRVRIEADTLVLRSTFEAAGSESGGVRRGGPHGLFRDNQNRIVLHHEFAPRSQLVYVDCNDWDRVETRVVAIPEAIASGALAESDPSSEDDVGLIGLGTRLRRGAVPVGSEVLMATSIIVDIPDAKSRTLITLADGASPFMRGFLDGRWTFHDVSGDGDILISTNQPTPRALLLDGAGFSRALRR